MNPRKNAILIYEYQAKAMRNMEDPVAPIEKALWAIRQDAINEAIEVCQKAKDDGLEQSIQDYNAGCDDCIQGIMMLKGKISF